MDVTKPYKLIGFGAMDVTKPYKIIGFGVMDVTKPYTSIGFGAMDVTKPYKFIGFGAMDVTVRGPATDWWYWALFSLLRKGRRGSGATTMNGGSMACYRCL